MRMATGAHAYRKMIGRSAAALTKANGRKQNKMKQTSRRRKTTRHLQTTHIRATCGLPTMASEPARTRLLQAILTLVLLVTYKHATACRSPALVFSAAIHFAMKRSAHRFRRLTAFLVGLGFSRQLVRADTESSEVVEATPHLLFFLTPHAIRAPHQFYDHHAPRQSLVFHARFKSREKDPPPPHYHLDTLTSCLHKSVSK